MNNIEKTFPILYEQLHHKILNKLDKHNLIFDGISILMGCEIDNIICWRIELKSKYAFYDYEGNYISTVSGGLSFEKSVNDEIYFYHLGRFSNGLGWQKEATIENILDFNKKNMIIIDNNNIDDLFFIGQLVNDLNVFLNHFYENFLIEFDLFSNELKKQYNQDNIATNCPTEIMQIYVRNTDIDL